MRTESVSELIQRAIGHHGRGALEEASRLYSRVLQREPEHSDALHLMGVVAHQQGRNQEAVALITRAIAGRPQAPAFRNNLGMALAALGRTADAERAFRDALALSPDFPDAVLNLGNLVAGQGQFDDALTLLERAVSLDAGVPQAHYGLGRARVALGDRQGALEAFRRVVALGADFADVHYHIGSIHLAGAKLAEAVVSFRRALARDGDHRGAQHGLLECLDRLPAAVDSAQLENVVLPLLRAGAVNPRSVGHAAARLIERKHRLHAGAGSDQTDEAICDRLLNDELVRGYLERTVNVGARLEPVLTRCRARWLAGALDGNALSPSRWSGVVAVAIQCFLNEFVWRVTSEEERAADVLGQRINEAAFAAGSPDDRLISDLTVYACYRPLWRIDCAARLRSLPAGSWPSAVDELLRVCVHEPLRERDLRSHITSGAAIRDEVSKAVQAQYEESPYPRWLSLTRGSAHDIEQRVRRWCPGFVAPPALRGPLRVLVAGCGTGMDAIDAALHLNNARVTAIDLSLASLAYAMRKAEEYGLENIHFRREDILELGGDGGSYHVVHCTGVLHHMQDPAAGLRRLAALLVPGGLIKLALYSEAARAPLAKAFEAIRASDLGPRASDIRAFRQQVLAAGTRGPLAELLGSTDFYSLSECRDLLFHAHEVHLTLPRIRSLLQETGLEFLGFELAIDQVEQGFRREYPDAALTDLDAWAAYEERHPQSFRSMYQFWCQKTRV